MGSISTLIYTSELILSFTICVLSATRHEIHVPWISKMMSNDTISHCLFIRMIIFYLGNWRGNCTKSFSSFLELLNIHILQIENKVSFNSYSKYNSIVMQRRNVKNGLVWGQSSLIIAKEKKTMISYKYMNDLKLTWRHTTCMWLQL